MGGKPKKRFSQNFLADKNIARKIVDYLEITPDDTVLEIGSGRGTLTSLMTPWCRRLVSFEIDRDLITELQAKFSDQKNVEIVNTDFLKADPSDYTGDKFKLIGNIPYDITSPLLDWMITHRARISRAVITTQKELATRISSKPGGKDWAPVAIFCQCFFEIEQVLTIPPAAFYPPPRVYSATLVFKPDARFDITDWDYFRTVVREAFRHRRKMLVNNLHGAFNIGKDNIQAVLRDIGLDENIRAEQVGIEEFIRLTEKIKGIELS